ncbi:MAG: hypothetical protein KJZ85_18265 [Rhodobacteraceae bacterium]|jgi:hypothetical protein|nr:hypothetical protein [Paracoccaceae bacterium]
MPAAPLSLLSFRRPHHAAAALAAALALAVPGPAAATDAALLALVPLVEVYAAGRSSPGFDVAGIRCAGLFAAQHDWSRRHPGISPPSPARLADIDTHLTAARIHREGQGMAIAAAHSSVQQDARRVLGLYQAHFAGRQEAAGHPWDGDRLVRTDSSYCDLLGGRR